MAHIHEKLDFTGAIFVVKDAKVLLILHSKLGKWLPLGGHMELDEDPENRRAPRSEGPSSALERSEQFTARCCVPRQRQPQHSILSLHPNEEACLGIHVHHVYTRSQGPQQLVLPQHFSTDQAKEFAALKDLHLKVARGCAAKELFSKFWAYQQEGRARRCSRTGLAG